MREVIFVIFLKNLDNFCWQYSIGHCHVFRSQRQAFPFEQEQQFTEYVKNMESMLIRIFTRSIRSLSYQLATEKQTLTLL